MNGSKPNDGDNLLYFSAKPRDTGMNNKITTVSDSVSGGVSSSMDEPNVVTLDDHRNKSISNSQLSKTEVKKTISKESTKNSKLEANQYLSDSLIKIGKIGVRTSSSDQRMSEVERKKFYNSEIDLLEGDAVKGLWKILEDSGLETDRAIGYLRNHIQDKVTLLRSYVEEHKIKIGLSPSSTEIKVKVSTDRELIIKLLGDAEEYFSEGLKLIESALVDIHGASTSMNKDQRNKFYTSEMKIVLLPIIKKLRELLNNPGLKGAILLSYGIETHIEALNDFVEKSRIRVR